MVVCGCVIVCGCVGVIVCDAKQHHKNRRPPTAQHTNNTKHNKVKTIKQYSH
eukprot:m.27324 g.27324  ORF g.27324 m.27324 type:complete len:52 (-) comp15727_c1_seq1:1476-1631(-)